MIGQFIQPRFYKKIAGDSKSDPYQVYRDEIIFSKDHEANK